MPIVVLTSAAGTSTDAYFASIWSYGTPRLALSSAFTNIADGMDEHPVSSRQISQAKLGNVRSVTVVTFDDCPLTLSLRP